MPKVLVKGIVFLTVGKDSSNDALMIFSVAVRENGLHNKLLYAWRTKMPPDSNIAKVVKGAANGEASAVSKVHAHAGGDGKISEPTEGITYLSYGDDETKDLDASVYFTEAKDGFDAQLEVSTNKTKRYASIRFLGDPPALSNGNGKLMLIAFDEKSAEKQIKAYQKYLNFKASTKK